MSFDWALHFEHIYCVKNDIYNIDSINTFRTLGILNSGMFSYIYYDYRKPWPVLKDFKHEATLRAVRDAHAKGYGSILIITDEMHFSDVNTIHEVLTETKQSVYAILNPGDIREDCIRLSKKAIKYIATTEVDTSTDGWWDSIISEIEVTRPKKQMCRHKIDYVVTYVDSSDKLWQREYRRYKDTIKESRFKSWENLDLHFKLVKKNMPWIDKLWLIVSSVSQVPQSISKLGVNVVLHSDIIPRDLLPTFNSCTIEMYMFRIKSLSEYYIYGNDDLFVINRAEKEDFIRDGKLINTMQPVKDSQKMYNKVCVNNYHVLSEFNDPETHYKLLHKPHMYRISTGLRIAAQHDLHSICTRFRSAENANQYIYHIYEWLCGETLEASERSVLYISEKNIDALNGENQQKFLCINDIFINDFENVKMYVNSVLMHYLTNGMTKITPLVKKRTAAELKVALCGIAKNENDYIREWVEWYKNIGITKIFLYDNNDVDGEHFEDVIGDYISGGYVEVIDYRGVVNTTDTDKDGMSTQGQAYLDCFNKNYTKYDWICYFDIDELLCIDHTYAGVREMLMDYMDHDGVKIQWRMYGDNGHIRRSPGGMVERFKSVSNAHHDRHIKTILRCKDLQQDLRFCAHGLLNKGLDIVTLDGKQLQNSYLDTEVKRGLCAYLDHYFSKSTEEYMYRKFNRTSAVTGVNYKRNFSIEFLNQQYFKYNRQTREKVDYIENYVRAFSNVDVYMASRYGDGHVISAVKSIIRQPEVRMLTISANEYTDAQVERLIREVGPTSKLTIHRTKNERTSFEKFRYVNDGDAPYIAFCDDDIIYYDGYFNNMVMKCYTLDSPVSYHGGVLKSLPIQKYYTDRKMYSFTMNVRNDVIVDIIGSGVSMHRRDFLTPEQWYSIYESGGSVPMDDIVMSYVLRREGYSLYVVKHVTGELNEKKNNKTSNTVYNTYKDNDSVQTEYINTHYTDL